MIAMYLRAHPHDTDTETIHGRQQGPRSHGLERGGGEGGERGERGRR